MVSRERAWARGSTHPRRVGGNSVRRCGGCFCKVQRSFFHLELHSAIHSDHFRSQTKRKELMHSSTPQHFSKKKLPTHAFAPNYPLVLLYLSSKTNIPHLADHLFHGWCARRLVDGNKPGHGLGAPSRLFYCLATWERIRCTRHIEASSKQTCSSSSLP